MYLKCGGDTGRNSVVMGVLWEGRDRREKGSGAGEINFIRKVKKFQVVLKRDGTGRDQVR